MARNDYFGNQEGLVPFNCYKSFVNEKGRLIKDNIAYERIWCKIENTNVSRNNVNNVVRAVGYDATFTTTSPNTLEEDYYIMNRNTGEVWRIQNITKVALNHNANENSARIKYLYTLGCSR